MRKINQVMLVDDDEISNFLTSTIIKQTGLVEEIIVCHDGAEALATIQKGRAAAVSCPELILLDLNMPTMNGFDFLEAYGKLGIQPCSSVIIVLSTTTHVMDYEMLAKYPEIEIYLNKPLTQESFLYIMNKHFS